MNLSLAPLFRRVGEMRWRHAAFILLAVFVIANWLLLTGQAQEKWDGAGLCAPFYSLLADFTRAGKLLYWNPWLAGGSPDFAVAGAGTFSPDLLLAAAITGPGAQAYVYYWLALWLTGGLGMLLLARHLHAPVWGGLIIALGFVFSGYYTGHAEHSSVLYAYTVLPFLIWRLDVAITQRKLLAALQAGALWGMSGLGGYPALTFFTVPLIVAWAIGRYLQTEKTERAATFSYAGLSVVIVGVVGVAIFSPSYTSAVYEGRGYSERSQPLHRNYALESNALEPGALATLSSPALVTIPLKEFYDGKRNLWSTTDLSSLNLYTGALTLLLALVALTGKTERRWRWYLCVIALLALASALSAALPLRGWLYDLLPPTRYFRHSSMLRGYFLFLLSILGLLGAHDLNTDDKALRRLIVLAPILALGAVTAFAIVLANGATDHPEYLLAVAHALVVWGGLLVFAFFLRRRSLKLASYLPAIFIALAVIDGLAAMHFTQLTVFDKGARDPLPLPSDSSVALGPEKFARAAGDLSGNPNFYFKVPTLRGYEPFRNRFHELIASNPALQAMGLGHERIWFASDAPDVSPNPGLAAHFAKRWNDVQGPIILRHSREKMLQPLPPNKAEVAAIAQAPAAVHADFRVLDYQPNRLLLETSAPSDGWLLVSDRWSRSWHATVNGVEQPISGANFIFRAVPVTKGANRIDFSYRPIGMPWLIMGSWSLLGIIMVLSLVRLPLRSFRLTSAELIAPDLLPAAE